MLFNLKQKNTSSSAKKKSADAADLSDYVPYYAHYNPHTLLTKNGEVMQTIKIASTLSGLNYEGTENPAHAAREIIRKAVRECIDTDHIALWMHVIRKRRPIENRWNFKESFAGVVHDRWQKKHDWKYEYYNEIYVSILCDAQSAKLAETKFLKDTILPASNREFRNLYLDQAAGMLDDISEQILARLGQHFIAARLGVVERLPTNLPIQQSIFYSEPMEFLGTLINLRDGEFPLPQADMSQALFSTTPTFGFNAIETKDDAGKRRFAAIMALKQYREVPLDTMDILLQSPMEFIVSEAFHFVPTAGALAPYKEQKDYFEISGDTYCIAASGLEDMIVGSAEGETDFGEHQISIMMISDEFKTLETELQKTHDAFSQLGLIPVREDLKIEECFWAQLPGNFEFLRRRDTVNTHRIGGFLRLNRYPHGEATGNHWGDALTLFPTMVKSPYFFNFHHQDNGHSVILDFNSFGDKFGKVLTNFLVAQSRKFSGRTYIFDRDQSADLFFQKMGGKYQQILSEKTAENITLNPFGLEDTPRNQSFLVAWCMDLISPHVRLPEMQKETLQQAIAELYTLAPQQQHLGGLAAIIAAKDAPLAEAFNQYRPGGTAAGLFSHHESLDMKAPLQALNMDIVATQKDLGISIFTYLMHRIVSELDGTPTIIVLHEAWDLIENNFIAPRLESLLEIMTQNNAMILFTTSRPMQVAGAQSFEAVMKACASQIILPDDITRNYQTVPAFAFSDEDQKTLTRMKRQDGHFLLKQARQVVSLQADIHSMDDLYVIFANDVKNLATVMGKFSTPEPGHS